MLPKRTRDAIEDLLADLQEEYFSKDVKLTFVMRHPKDDECWAIITEDDVNELAELLARSEEDADETVGVE